MNDNTSPNWQHDYVQYRCQRAQELLQTTKAIINLGDYNSAMNRLYYACFQVVLGLLLHHGIEAKTHEGVKRMLGNHFIKTGIIDREMGRFYSRVLEARIQADYDDKFDFDRETCEILFTQGQQFVVTILQLIEQGEKIR